MTGFLAACVIVILTATASSAEEARFPPPGVGLVHTIDDSFACKTLDQVIVAAKIIASGTKAQLVGYLMGAVSDGSCFLTKKGDVFLLEKKISNAAFFVRRMRDRACNWMPGEAFE